MDSHDRHVVDAMSSSENAIQKTIRKLAFPGKQASNTYTKADNIGFRNIMCIVAGTHNQE